MKRVRWVTDGDWWELDMSTPLTLEATARAVPENPQTLGLSRGTRLTRPKQIDFFHRFMAIPLVPSYSPLNGFSLQRLLTVPFFNNNWFSTVLAQFDIQKLVSSVKQNWDSQEKSNSSRLQSIGNHLRDKSLYALSFCSEFLLTPDATVLLSCDSYNADTPRKKAVLYHKFPHHNLTVEAVSPGLFVDKNGDYWDVPVSVAVDLASAVSDSGWSYHFLSRYNEGLPKQYEGDETCEVPTSLLPRLSVTSAVSYKSNFDIWRSKAQKLKMVQPFDVFLSNPHVSASGIIGAVMTASFGDNSIRSEVREDLWCSKGFSFYEPALKSGVIADVFARISLTAHHGNFQRLFSDLTRCHARLDFPSGFRLVSGAKSLARDLFDSRRPSIEAVQAVCPKASFSLQQQIAGPFIFRVDSGVSLDLKNREYPVRMDDPVFAVEYALQVLGSAKAVAWYSPKQKEFMIELRFFET